MDALPEVALEADALFIGDLHLDATREDSSAHFRAWLAQLQGVPRLVVLGDLFDAWVGPAHARLDGARVVLEALRAFAQRGAALDLVPGNRDFLLGDDFEQKTGARIRPHGFVGVLPQTRERLLAVHGDELCTLDVGYQRLKRVVRSRPVRWLAPRLPDAMALWAARRMRRASQSAVAMKPAAEKEQQEAEVRALCRASACSALICGHAHRFRDQRLPEGPRWIVVDAFGGPRDVLRVSAAGELEASGSDAGHQP